MRRRSERALRARGFKIVRPETLGAREQVALMRDADHDRGRGQRRGPGQRRFPVAGRAGDRDPARQFHQPVGEGGLPTGRRRMAGLYLRRAVLAGPGAAAPARLRRGFKFAFKPDLDDLLRFVDAAL